jgi:hypothetical protein
MPTLACDRSWESSWRLTSLVSNRLLCGERAVCEERRSWDSLKTGDVGSKPLRSRLTRLGFERLDRGEGVALSSLLTSSSVLKSGMPAERQQGRAVMT